MLMKSEVTKSLVPPANRIVPYQRRPAARQHRASVVQPAQQISDRRHLGGRRTGRLSFEDVRRHVACREPGHVAAELLALRYLRGGEDQQELDVKLFVNNIFNKLYYTGLYQSSGAVRAGGAWPRGVADDLGEVLRV